MASGEASSRAMPPLQFSPKSTIQLSHRKPMIKLQSDTLEFSFPEIEEALNALVEGYVQTTLQSILAESREAAVSALAARWSFKGASEKERQKAIEKVRHATGAELADALRKTCRERANPYYRETIASVSIALERTLRIPDDGKVYPLPAGLGAFPLRHVDDFEKTVPQSWLRRGGVMMPMYQSEALWIFFASGYPCAVKVGAGKINAVTGEGWKPGLQREPQDYVVLPEQPWLDGFAVSKGLIRQFVAMPLGDGYSVEEQLTGKADVGGLQFQVIPMKVGAYFESLKSSLPTRLEDLLKELVYEGLLGEGMCLYAAEPCADMGLGAGGRMRQEVFADPHDADAWDAGKSARCFVHLCNSLMWREITGENPPQPPLTAKEYARYGTPWFDYYRDDLKALPGSKTLHGVKSVSDLSQEKKGAPLHGNESISPEQIIQYGNTRRPDEVREWVDS